MNGLNIILLEGNLCRDSEYSTTSTGAGLCKFAVACSRYFPSKTKEGFSEEVSFFDIVTWGKLAETCSELRKGRRVRIQGRLKQDRWTTTEGKVRSRVVIVADKVSFFTEKNKGYDSGMKKDYQDVYPENDSVKYDDEVPF